MFDTKFFPGAKKFWHNGKMFEWNSINVHVMSHAIHYGSSVFEGIRAYDTENGPAIFRLPEHLERFYLSASVINMQVPYTIEEITDAIKQVMKVNRLKAAYIRPNLFYGYGNLGLVPKVCPVELTVGCWAWGAYLGDDSLEKGVHVLLMNRRRIHPSQMDMRAKIGGMYAQSNIAGASARAQGFDEGVFLNMEGRIAEGPGENIIIIKNNKLTTNDENESILPGITRTTALKLAEDMGYDVEIAPITVEAFFAADEIFFTGTAAEITPICRITDGREQTGKAQDLPIIQIGDGRPGPVTKRILQKYGAVVRGEEPKYDNWLTCVYDSKEEFNRYFNE